MCFSTRVGENEERGDYSLLNHLLIQFEFGIYVLCPVIKLQDYRWTGPAFIGGMKNNAR